MNSIKTVLAIIISLGVICSATAASIHYLNKKVDREIHEKFMIETEEKHETKVNKEDYSEFVASTNIQFLEQHRRYLSQRLMVLRTNYPSTYHTLSEYNALLQELQQVDMKINAYYQRGGK